MLASALRRLDGCDDPDDRVYAVETSPGVRRYTIMTPTAAWDQTRGPNDSHLYEVLSGPCNLYLDIEWTCESKPPAGSEESKVMAAVLHVRSTLNGRYGEADPVVTSVSASGVTAKGYKCSWHVHIACRTVMWLNTVAVGQFVRAVCSDISIVDKVPYAGTGQNWRCVGSSKAAEPARAFLPADEHTFHSCTVQQPAGGRRMIYPDVRLATPVTALPSYILILAATLDATTDPVMCSETRCIVPFREKQYCEHVGRYHRSNHQYAVIDTQSLVWKMKCHACADAVSSWRPFENTAEVLKAYEKQVAGYTPNVPHPAVRVAGTAVHLDLRTLGPPPIHSHFPVRCRDGVYGV